MIRVGVLALQGAFAEHIAVLQKLKVEAYEVRLPSELKGLNGLIIPGGESTSIGILMRTWGLVEPIKAMAKAGSPILGTCAGLILLAKKVYDLPFEALGLLDITVRRNAFGRQVDSFETELTIPALGEAPFPGVFIRAPIIEEVGEGVEVLCSLPSGIPVAVRQGKILGTAFHPELTKDPRLHAYFLNLFKE